mgnify:CR=1 FL=1
MVIVVNKIDMSCGKMAVQVAHAAVDCSLRAWRKRRRMAKQWLKEGQKKVVLEADEEEILMLEKKAKEMGILTSLIRDAGLTELEPGTLTALAIGPDEEEKIDKITGHLPLK